MTDKKSVYECISEVTAKIAVAGISKDKKNKMQGYNFRGIDDVYNALAPILSEVGLDILPSVTHREQSERATQKGGVLFTTVVTVDYMLVSKHDGSSHRCTVYGEAMDSADKSTNKAMSAAYKYLCLQAFCIPTEGDNDADATTHVVEKAKPKMITGQEYLDLQEKIRLSVGGLEFENLKAEAKEKWKMLLPAQQAGITKAVQIKEQELDSAPTA